MKKQEQNEIAAFRFGVTAPVVQRNLKSGQRYALLRELAMQSYKIPYIEKTRISIRSLERWLQACERGAFEDLRPHVREKRGSLNQMDQDFYAEHLNSDGSCPAEQ